MGQVCPNYLVMSVYSTGIRGWGLVYPWLISNSYRQMSGSGCRYIARQITLIYIITLPVSSSNCICMALHSASYDIEYGLESIALETNTIFFKHDVILAPRWLTSLPHTCSSVEISNTHICSRIQPLQSAMPKNTTVASSRIQPLQVHCARIQPLHIPLLNDTGVIPNYSRRDMILCYILVPCRMITFPWQVVPPPELPWWRTQPLQTKSVDRWYKRYTMPHSRTQFLQSACIEDVHVALFKDPTLQSTSPKDKTFATCLTQGHNLCNVPYSRTQPLQRALLNNTTVRKCLSQGCNRCKVPSSRTPLVQSALFKDTTFVTCLVQWYNI